MLLLAAGLSLRALQKAGSMELGFNPRQMITASYDLVLQNYPAPRREAFRRELVARLEALPGVSSATIANVPPLSGIMYSTIVTSTDDRGEPVEGRAYMNAVGPRYFTTLEMPLVAGREIGVQDGRGAPGAAVINETLARRLWPARRSARTDDAPRRRHTRSRRGRSRREVRRADRGFASFPVRLARPALDARP